MNRMSWLTESRTESLERVAGRCATWLASPAAQGGPHVRRDEVARRFGALATELSPEAGLRVEPLECAPVDDASPMATFLTLSPRGEEEPEVGAVVLFGVHTAMVLAQAGVPGCRLARLDPGTGRFVVTEPSHVMPRSGAVELLGGRSVGAALYRVLLTGGAVVGPGMDPDAEALVPRPVRDRAAALLLEAAGGVWISASAFGSTRVLGELAAHRAASAPLPASPPPSLVEPLFGARGLFRP